jgi:hypothetical protein
MIECGNCEYFKSKHAFNDYHCEKDGRCFLDPPEKCMDDRGHVTGWERPQVNQHGDGCAWGEPKILEETQ